MGGKNTKLSWTKVTPKNSQDTANVPESREHHTSVLFFGNTKMIIYGGFTHWDNKLPICSGDVFEFNFMSTAWVKYNCSSTDSNFLPEARCSHSAVNINEKMIVFGGLVDGKEVTNEIYELDIAKRAWTKIESGGQIPGIRNGHTAVVLNETKMLVFGGSSDADKTFQLGDLFEWDYDTKIWTQINASYGPGPRVCHSAVAIFDRSTQSQKMAIYGGCDTDNALLGDIVIFDYEEKTWERMKQPSEAPSNRKSQSVVYWDNKLILFGGWSEGYMDVGESLFDIHCYSFANNRWEALQIKPNAILARYNHGCVLYEDSMMVFGGSGEKLSNPGDLYECSLDGLHREWEIEWSDVEVLSRIGEGQYGTVYSGFLKQRSHLAQQIGQDTQRLRRTASAVDKKSKPEVVPVRKASMKDAKECSSNSTKAPKIKVAIKKMKLQNIPKVDFQLWLDFKREVNLLRKLNHPNVLNFLGACLQEPNVCVLTDFMQKGCLHDVLLDSRVEMPFHRKLKITLDVAKGIEYLHKQTPPILHRDLKSMNILIDDDFNAKVCDFGLARIKQTTMTLTGKQGTPLWMSPQMLSGDPSGEMCDVYSFAIVMWEILTRQLPYKGEKSFHVTAAVVRGEKRPALPELSSLNKFEQRFVQLMTTCWAQNPKDRFPFTKIIETLEQLSSDLSSDNEAQK